MTPPASDEDLLGAWLESDCEPVWRQDAMLLYWRRVARRGEVVEGPVFDAMLARRPCGFGNALGELLIAGVVPGHAYERIETCLRDADDPTARWALSQLAARRAIDRLTLGEPVDLAPLFGPGTFWAALTGVKLIPDESLGAFVERVEQTSVLSRGQRRIVLDRVRARRAAR